MVRFQLYLGNDEAPCRGGRWGSGQKWSLSLALHRGRLREWSSITSRWASLHPGWLRAGWAPLSSQGRAIFGYLMKSVCGLFTVLTRIKLSLVAVGTHKRNKAGRASNDTVFSLLAWPLSFIFSFTQWFTDSLTTLPSAEHWGRTVDKSKTLLHLLVLALSHFSLLLGFKFSHSQTFCCCCSCGTWSFISAEGNRSSGKCEGVWGGYAARQWQSWVLIYNAKRCVPC